jgi:hypothetical protein
MSPWFEAKRGSNGQTTQNRDTYSMQRYSNFESYGRIGEKTGEESSARWQLVINIRVDSSVTESAIPEVTPTAQQWQECRMGIIASLHTERTAPGPFAHLHE